MNNIVVVSAVRTPFGKFGGTLKDIPSIELGAIGHPVGASGVRILMTLIYELRRRGGGIGVASICGGLAQGDGAVVQVVSEYNWQSCFN
jgi:acetyl-CoA acetyltransferase